jgi:hypothetical protein
VSRGDVFEPLKAIDALNDYMVVGGWGTLQHGATRLTQDLDICPRTTGENLERLARALAALHAELQIAPGQTVPVPIIDARLLAQIQIGNWSTDADLMSCNTSQASMVVSSATTS